MLETRSANNYLELSRLTFHASSVTLSRLLTSATNKGLTPKIAFNNSTGTIDLAAQAFDRLRHKHDLFSCLFPVSLFNRFTDRGKRFDAIASVESRRIDLVSEPRSPR